MDHVFIDEAQDFAGYDLDILKLFLGAQFQLTMAGDYRQATLATNQSAKYKKYRYAGMIELFQEWEHKELCEIEHQTTSHRCITALCDFAELTFPDAPATISDNEEAYEHAGVFLVKSDDVTAYVEQYQPQILRNDKRTNCQGYPAINFGISKGLTFDRCLIFPTGPIKKTSRDRRSLNAQRQSAVLCGRNPSQRCIIRH